MSDERLSMDSALTRNFLLNVADAIRNVLIPELEGSAVARAGECVGTLIRVVQSLSPASPASEALAETSPAPEDWKAVAEVEGQALDRAESMASAAREAVASIGSSRTFDREKLELYLQRHPLGGAAVRVTQCRQLAGGRSKQTILVSQTGAASLPADFVVRQDWASAVTGTSVVSEFELLKLVFAAGLRVPQPLLLEKSADAMGAPFLVVTRMPGGPQGDLFNPPRSEALALQVARQLAGLHRLPVEDFARLGVPTEAYLAEQLRAGLDGFRGLNTKLGIPARTIEIALDWLAANIDRVDGGKTLLHNDLGCHNFLIDGETLTAILDWELAHIGNPAADLGYIRAWIGKMMPWDRFMQAYRDAGGPAVSEHTLDFYTLWCGVRLYCLLLQARAGVAMGMVKDTEITYAVAEFMPVLLHRISQELRAVLNQTG